jgi:hypothetical protein
MRKEKKRIVVSADILVKALKQILKRFSSDRFHQNKF